MTNVVRTDKALTATAPPVTLSKRLHNALGRDWGWAWFLMLPTVLLMGGIIAYPFLRAVYISFTNTVSVEIGPFVGFKNYIEVWGDQFFRRSLWITTKYTVASVVLKVVFGTLIAVLLNRLGRWGGILTGLVLLPWIVPDIVRAITWKSMLDPIYGGANRLLLDLNIIDQPLLFLSGIDSALPTLVVINLWQGIPFFVINILAGLKAIDKELYEAAAIDGASGWRQFLHVTLPGLKYVLIVVTLLSTIWTFNTFTLIFLLTNGGPMDATKVYSILSYNWGIGAQMYGKGIAVALTMAPILFFFIMILGKYMMQGRRLYDVDDNTRARRPEQDRRSDRLAVQDAAHGARRGLLGDQQRCRELLRMDRRPVSRRPRCTGADGAGVGQQDLAQCGAVSAPRLRACCPSTG